MSGIDVRDLKTETLAPSKFPVAPDGDFRCYISPAVKRGIDEHAAADVSVEICGVLVGQWHVDDDGPFASVTDFIRCDNAASKSAEVTFTHDSWAQINQQMDSRFADKRIVGWYHSHPDFGIFLSERDCFIHEHFFSGPGQVALVVDPVRELEGVFAWRNGKPTPLTHYWIGDQIRTGDASRSMATDPSAASEQPEVERPVGAPTNAAPSLGTPVAVLGLLLVFLLGYFYGGWRSRWEQEMIVQGAVAHFADAKLLRLGLEEQAAAIRRRLATTVAELKKLPAPGAKLSEQEKDAAAKRRQTIRDNLALSVAAIGQLEKRYGLSEVERSAYAQIIAQKQAELRRLIEEQKGAAEPKGADRKAAGKPSTRRPDAKSSDQTKEQPAAPAAATSQQQPDQAEAPTE